MNSDDDIDELPLEEEGFSDTQEDSPKTRKAIGFKTLLAGMIIAAGGGAAGGAFLSKVITPPAAPAVKTDLSTVNGSLDALTRDTKALKSAFSEVQKQVSRQAEITTPKPADLSPLLARIKALEVAAGSAAPVIDEALLARLEALQGEGSPALDLSDITKRLTALEAASTGAEQSALIQELTKKQAEQARALQETQAALQSAPQAAPQVSIAPLATLSEPDIVFPEAQILAALKGLDKSEGWAKRTLNKHISVKSEDDPSNLVAGIKLDLDNGDIDAAASKFDRLPSQLRSAGQDWRAAITPAVTKPATTKP